MSIHWIRNVLVEKDKTTLEILLGDHEISDKCYARVNSGSEHWFVPKGETRDEVMQQGIDILKSKFGNVDVEMEKDEDGGEVVITFTSTTKPKPVEETEGEESPKEKAKPTKTKVRVIMSPQNVVDFLKDFNHLVPLDAYEKQIDDLF